MAAEPAAPWANGAGGSSGGPGEDRAEALPRTTDPDEIVRILTANITDIVFRVELVPEVRATYVSPAATAVCGYTPRELCAEPSFFALLVHPDDHGRVRDWISGDSDPQGPVVARWIHKHGHLLHVEHRLRRERDSSGTVVALEGVARDVTDRVRMENELEYATHRDTTTGLASHRAFEEAVAAHLAGADRDATSVVLVVQIDRFPAITELVGRDAADRLLRAAGERLVHATSPEVLVAKGRDDQFWILHPRADRSAAEAVLRHITAAFHQPFVTDGRELYLTLSAGATMVSPADAPPVGQVLTDADAALRTAPPSGLRLNVRWFEPWVHVRSASRLELDNDLRRAVDDGEITVAYQPQLDLASGRVVGLEALARWDRPGHGPVSPAEFIAVAEETGLIANLGDHVLFAAARQAARWRAAGVLTDQRLSVNMSRRQLGMPDLAAWVLEVVGAVGLPPVGLTIEVTETAVMDAGDRAAAQLQALSDAGVRISVDDFGTGYSSLTALRSLPVHEMKIDREFVSGLGSDLGDTVICRAVISLAEGFGLQLVAEGVETTAQARTLLELGCTVGQGYLFSEPLSAAEIPDLLVARAD